MSSISAKECLNFTTEKPGHVTINCMKIFLGEDLLIYTLYRFWNSDCLAKTFFNILQTVGFCFQFHDLEMGIS